MRQLPLQVQLADYAVFASFLPGRNAACVGALQAIAAGRERGPIWIWGPAGCGKTHLLQACVTAGDAAGLSSAFLPLADSGVTLPEMLDGMEAMDLLCVDDLQLRVGDSAWERRLFRLFEEMRARGGRLVVAATGPVATLAFGLPDLASRFTWGGSWRVHALNDAERAAALRLRAHWRGMDLPDETVRFLLSRTDRHPAALFELLDRLDIAALAAGRRLTVPFVKTVLEP